MGKGAKRVFVGREEELETLRGLLQTGVANLVVLRGRRRIGKSRLAEEFGKSFRTLNFLGLAPERGVGAKAQRSHFARHLATQLQIGKVAADDWDDLFLHLARQTASGPVLIVLDEINWMGSKDPTFLPKLKSAWDAYFSKNPELILILSGSMSGWIEKNILSSTGFFGRVTLDLTLHELPLDQCAKFWGAQGKQISAYEKFKVLSVTGGVPRYLELIRADQTAEENIARLCFRSEGILFNEFDRIFSDLFSRRTNTYKKIVEQTVNGPVSMEEIFANLDHRPSGTLSGYLDDLVQTRYLSRDYAWEIKSGRRSRRSLYRLSDNYLRFYLRYIEPHREAVESTGKITSPSWHAIMGLQFENLVLKNLTSLCGLLGIKPEQITQAGPYFQVATKRRQGCQIDLLIQTRQNVLYLCEVKFSKREIRPSVVEEVQEKISRLDPPKGFSVSPVLIHVNGVTDAVEDADFFSQIIDFSQLLDRCGDS